MSALEVSPFHGIALYKSTFSYLLILAYLLLSTDRIHLKLMQQCTNDVTGGSRVSVHRVPVNRLLW